MTDLRPLTSDAAESIAGWVRSRADAVLAGGPRFPYPLTGADLLAIDADPAWRVFVLTDQDGRAVATGSLFAKLDGRVQRIGRVLVDPERRGQGWGRRVLECLLARIDADPSVIATELAVFTHNEVARELYRRLGFARSGASQQLEVAGELWRSEEYRRPRHR